MSKLLPLLFVDSLPVAGGGSVEDLQIKFASPEDWIDLDLQVIGVRRKGKSLIAKYLIAAVETTGPHVVIQVLMGPHDFLESHRLLTHGNVVARGAQDADALIFNTVGYDDAISSFRVRFREMTKKLSNTWELFLIEDPAIAKNADEQRIIERAQSLVGTEQAEAWFNYQPLPAFDNQTPRQLVDEGKADAVLLHLGTLEDGVYA